MRLRKPLQKVLVHRNKPNGRAEKQTMEPPEGLSASLGVQSINRSSIGLVVFFFSNVFGLGLVVFVINI